MSKIIKRLNPNCTIIGNKNSPRSGAFEITKDEKLVFSKFKTSEFPTELEIKSWL